MHLGSQACTDRGCKMSTGRELHASSPQTADRRPHTATTSASTHQQVARAPLQGRLARARRAQLRRQLHRGVVLCVLRRRLQRVDGVEQHAQLQARLVEPAARMVSVPGGDGRARLLY